jgi:hypothetical protein
MYTGAIYDSSAPWPPRAGKVQGPVQAPCGHWTCCGCMKDYVAHHLKERRLPVRCPATQCGAALSDAAVETLLSRAELDRYHAILAESLIPAKSRVYCPHPQCSAAFDGSDANAQATCPYCHNDMCVACKSAWHEGATCAQFAALKPALRSPGDVALLKLAGEEGWRACPGCAQLIERNKDGCNWVRCVCDCRFCYACGLRYLDDKPTATNVHGQPACSCNLFAELVPRNALEDQAFRQEAVKIVRNQRVRRVNRRDPNRRNCYFKMAVLPQRCHRSATLAGCPSGRKWWFTHDDEPKPGQAAN